MKKILGILFVFGFVFALNLNAMEQQDENTIVVVEEQVVEKIGKLKSFWNTVCKIGKVKEITFEKFNQIKNTCSEYKQAVCKKMGTSYKLFFGTKGRRIVTIAAITILGITFYFAIDSGRREEVAENLNYLEEVIKERVLFFINLPNETVNGLKFPVDEKLEL